LNGHPYPDKPVLYFWIVAAVGTVVGQGETAFRLVTTLSTLAAMAGVYLVGQTVADRRVGFWATAVFATMLLTLIVGQIVRMDMLLTATAVFAWYALVRFKIDNAKTPLLAFWALSALALATKGPIALLFTVLPGLIWLAVEDGWRVVHVFQRLTGLAMLVGMVLLWVVAVIAAGHEEYLWTIWNEQLVGRAINAWSHQEPFYFYLVLLPILVMPWAGLVFRGAWILGKERPPYWQALTIFSLLPLLGISLVSGKLFIYLQPLLPAICIIAAMAAVRIGEEPRVSIWMAWPPILFLMLLAGAVGWISHQYLNPVRWWGFAIGFALFALAGIGIYLSKLHGRRWLYGWVGISVGVSWLLFGAMAYLLNPLFSGRDIGETIAQHTDSNRPVGVVNTTRGILNYYAGRLVEEVGIIEAGPWWESNQDAMLIIKTPDITHVFGDEGLPTCEIHETFFIEFKEYHVLADCGA
jgi:4-amino-4-deoxy-L-arabinose transferase-like glycosyltransferase